MRFHTNYCSELPKTRPHWRVSLVTSMACIKKYKLFRIGLQYDVLHAWTAVWAKQLAGLVIGLRGRSVKSLAQTSGKVPNFVEQKKKNMPASKILENPPIVQPNGGSEYPKIQATQGRSCTKLRWTPGPQQTIQRCFASSTTLDKARYSIESPWLSEVSRREPNGAHSSQLVYMHREQTVISVCMCATWLFRLFVLCISIFAFPWPNSRSRQGACDQFLIQPTAYSTYPFCARTDFCLC